MSSIFLGKTTTYKQIDFPFEDKYIVKIKIAAISNVTVTLPNNLIQNRNMSTSITSIKYLDTETNTLKNAYLFATADLNNNQLTIYNDSDSEKIFYVTIR